MSHSSLVSIRVYDEALTHDGASDFMLYVGQPHKSVRYVPVPFECLAKPKSTGTYLTDLWG
jgi:hypothetical protein